MTHIMFWVSGLGAVQKKIILSFTDDVPVKANGVSEMSNETLQPFERLGVTREALLYKLPNV